MERIRWTIVVLLVATGVIDLANATRPVVFIFGDSTADVGTNNFLPTSNIKANFPHNGVDFPFHIPTGRFSNGFNTADFLAKQFGHDLSPPPFLSVHHISRALLKPSFRGINFASGGSGLLQKTGNSDLTSNVNAVSFGEQIQQFLQVYESLVAIKGHTEAQKFISKSLFIISTGSNDIFEYYNSKRSSISKTIFTATLGLAYENHIKYLLNLGARKFGVVSVPPIGCCPSQRISNADGECVKELNGLALDFHAMIEKLLRELSSEYKGMKYSLGNAFEMSINVINNPLPFNFTQVKAACCGAGKLNAEAFCTPTANLCSHRKKTLFWDLFHPTEAASEIAAVTLYSGPKRFVSPINFSQLADA